MKSKYQKPLIILTILIIGLILIYFYFDGKRVHVLKEYSSTGKLVGTNEYILRGGDTIFDGKFVNYNERGIKISEGQFVDNEPNGLCTYYDDNGKKKVVHYRKNSEITLESTFFNPKGFIEKYVVYDDMGKSSFIMQFDEKGPTKYDGHFQIETYQYKQANKSKFNIKTDQILKVGDTLMYSYVIANIPNAKRDFQIENIGIDNTNIKRFLKKIPPAQIDVKEILTKKGKNTIRSIVKYEFQDNITPVFADTLSFEVNVY
ncbi:hypothetical protein [Flavobacterium sp. H4147]|uniref:hypothetical protein n=1 Tax=Flavobacterium sp. H4147 TaxID=3034149 RepID=UPI0023ECA831|nr:hypothetical protein [Flavobacterium sp. H4147]